jgi:hypothetical protein
MNFTGVRILMSSDVNHHMAATIKHQRRYKKKKKDRATTLKLEKEQEEDAAKRLEEVKAIYPQCSKCKYHFKSDIFLERHVCSGIFVPKDALSMVMRYADSVLATRDFSVDGNVASVSALFPAVEGMPSYATFEANFQLGWAHVRKNMHPGFSSRVEEFIHDCWQEGVASRVKVSAEAVVARLAEEYTSRKIRLAELPVVGQVRGSYQSIGQRKIANDAGENSTLVRKRRGQALTDANACGQAKKRRV